MKKNWEKGKKAHDEYTNGRDGSLAMRYSFNILVLFLQLILIALSLSLYKVMDLSLDKVMGLSILNYVFGLLVGTAILSYIINDTVLWRRDIFKVYFKEFDKEKIKSRYYFYVILFYLITVVSICICLDWTVGFSF